MTETTTTEPDAPWPAPFSDAFLRRARELLLRRPALVIIGPLGGSRNRLASDIAEAPDGPVWSRHVARHGEQGEAFFAIRQLFHGVHVSPDEDLSGVETLLRATMRAADDPVPTVVLANGELCDWQSIAVLARLAGSGDLHVIATFTPGTLLRHQQLMAIGEILEIPPLDASTVSELLRLRYGAVPHPTVVDLLLERTEGSYGVLREVCDAAFRSGALARRDGVLVLDAETAEQGRELAGRLVPHASTGLLQDPALVDLAQLTALLGRLEVRDVHDHVGARTLETALLHGALTVVDDGVRYASRAESSLILHSIPEGRHRELFDRYAHLLTRSVAQSGVAVAAADWWRAAQQLLPVDLAARAAREANLTGRFRRAVVYSDPDHNEKGEAVAFLERTYALRELGDLDDLDTTCAAADPADLTEDELLPYLRWLAHRAPSERRSALVARAVAADDPYEARRRSAVLTLHQLLERIFDEAGDELAGRLRVLAFSTHLSPADRAIAFAALSLVQRQSGRVAASLDTARYALRLLFDDPATISASRLHFVQEIHVRALTASLDLPAAAAAVSEYSRGIFDRPGSGRMTAALRCAVEMMRGDVGQALADARQCIASLQRHDPHHIRGWCEAMLAQLLAQVDQPEEARDLLDVSRRHAADRVQHELQRRIAIAGAHDSLAEPEEALLVLADVADEAHDRRLWLIEVEAAALAVQIGGPPHLPHLLDAVQGHADLIGVPQVWQRFAIGVKAYDIDDLAELAEHLGRQEARLYAAEIA